MDLGSINMEILLSVLSFNWANLAGARSALILFYELNISRVLPFPSLFVCHPPLQITQNLSSLCHPIVMMLLPSPFEPIQHLMSLLLI